MENFRVQNCHDFSIYGCEKKTSIDQECFIMLIQQSRCQIMMQKRHFQEIRDEIM